MHPATRGIDLTFCVRETFLVAANPFAGYPGADFFPLFAFAQPNARKALLENEVSNNIAGSIPESSAAYVTVRRAHCVEARSGWHITLKASKNLDLPMR